MVVSVDGVAGGSCPHEVDFSAFPEWDPKVGQTRICKLCGERVYQPKVYYPPLGEKIHLSKKERRRQKALQGGYK